MEEEQNQKVLKPEEAEKIIKTIREDIDSIKNQIECIYNNISQAVKVLEVIEHLMNLNKNKEKI